MEPELFFDLIKSNGKLDKTKLIQKEIIDKNGHHRKIWVKPKDSPTSQRPSKQPEPDKDKPAKKDMSPERKQIVDLLNKHGRKSLLEYAKTKGVTWKENDNEGINWMRCSMAINNHMKANPQEWVNVQIPDQNSQSQQSSQSDNQPTQSDSKKSTAQPKQKTDTYDKDKVKDLSKKYGWDKLLQKMKDEGIDWKENANTGINRMRALMSLGKAIQSDPTLYDKFAQDKVADDLKATQKQVKDLQDLVGKLQSPSAKQVSSQTQQADILKGITVGTKSSYEKKTFGDVIDTASPESLRNYRTLGMCAGDTESEKYLADLYQKYSALVDPSIVRDDYKSNIWADPLRNKIQGVVNASVAGVVKRSVVGMRKKSEQRVNKNFILEPWHNPNAFTDTDIENIKSVNKRSTQLEQARKDFALENGTHDMMKKILDKLDQHPDYQGDAKAYKALIEEYDGVTKGSAIIQEACMGTGSPVDVEKQIWDEVNKYSSWIKHNEGRIDECKLDIQNVDSNVGWSKSQKENYVKRVKTRMEEYSNNVKKYTKIVNDTKSALTSQGQTELVSNIKRARELQAAMSDKKFQDINVNLQHMKRVASELTRQYFVQKDFIDDYPVLSHDNIDKLDAGDEDSVTNLALYAGMFKPSLAKKGNAQDVIMNQFSERQAYIDAYGGVTQVSSNPSYAEDNEIHCKVSKASAKKSKEIIDNIAKDWDKSSHGNMKYKIKNVFEVSGLEVEQDFNKIKQKNKQFSKQNSGGKNCSSDLFYHGTGSMATSLILGHSGQFKLVKAKVGRMLGDGIYLADKSSKSAQYIGDSGYSRHGTQGSLMVVEASLGNTLHSRTSGAYNYDSIYAGKSDGLLNSEWCVHDPKAVIPRYLVEMEIQ